VSEMCVGRNDLLVQRAADEGKDEAGSQSVNMLYSLGSGCSLI